MSTYAEAHSLYRAAGWRGVLPLPRGKKWPPPDGYTGWHGADPSFADSVAWSDDEYAGTTQLALRMPDDVIGVDVDQYEDKRGALTLAEAERRWGKLPGAPISSARALPSGIRLYRVPPGTTLRTTIGFPELGLGDIEIIQRHHRYAVVWPSIHPSGGQYCWHRSYGPDKPPRPEQLEPLPASWLTGLSSAAAPGAEAADPATVAEFMRTHSAASAPGSLRGPLTVFERGCASKARHDAMNDAACMAAREARTGRYTAAAARTALREAFVQALAQARAGQRLLDPAASGREFDNMWAWAVSQALAEPIEKIQARNPPRMGGIPPAPVLTAGAHALAPVVQLHPAPEPEPAPAAVAVPDPPAPARGALNLPPDFWDARPSLKHIRDAALSQWACPDAVLGAVFARQSAYALPGDRVDIGLGPAPLTLFAIPYGSPSAGKGKAVQVARDLMPPPSWLDDADMNDGVASYRERPLGSGEGITESYYGIRTEQDPSNPDKTVKVRKQVRTNILFVMDEGEALTRLTGRQGATIATTIRRAWSGELLGEANASAERDRQLDQGSYSIGLIVSFQPATIGPLFDPNELGGGTPHRFLFTAADDDTLPEEPPEDLQSWPGPLPVQLGPDTEGMLRPFQKPDTRLFTLTDPDVRREVRQVRWDGLRRASTIGELDGHMNLMRGRVAAHLAWLDGRTDVTGEDWSLAGVVVDASNRVRDAAIAHGRGVIAREAQAQDVRHVQREAAAHAAKLSTEEQREQERTMTAAGVAARFVLRKAPAGTVARRELRDGVGKYKALLDAALDAATEREWLVAEDAKQGGTRYRVGPRIGECAR